MHQNIIWTSVAQDIRSHTASLGLIELTTDIRLILPIITWHCSINIKIIYIFTDTYGNM